MATVFTKEAASAANIQLVDEDKGGQAVHDLIVAYQANRRSGSANTKTRSEVKGSGKKIYKQKGTGNARHGDKQAPIFVGGGVAHGPRPRSYAKDVNKKTRRLALRRVLGDLTRDEKIFTVASFEVADGKTKSYISAVEAIAPDARKVAVIGKQFTAETERAAANVAWSALYTADEVNIENLMNAEAIVLVEDSFETLAARTA